ncbi:hypothetical protein PG984_004084 [Apiospora sp. TS-2023a]
MGLLMALFDAAVQYGLLHLALLGLFLLGQLGGLGDERLRQPVEQRRFEGGGGLAAPEVDVVEGDSGQGAAVRVAAFDGVEVGVEPGLGVLLVDDGEARGIERDADTQVLVELLAAWSIAEGVGELLPLRRRLVGLVRGGAREEEVDEADAHAHDELARVAEPEAGGLEERRHARHGCHTRVPRDVAELGRGAIPAAEVGTRRSRRRRRQPRDADRVVTKGRELDVLRHLGDVRALFALDGHRDGASIADNGVVGSGADLGTVDVEEGDSGGIALEVLSLRQSLGAVGGANPDVDLDLFRQRFGEEVDERRSRQQSANSQG